MAELKTNAYDGRYYVLTITQTPNTSNNTSLLKWSIKAVDGASSWYAERTLKAVIDGKTVYSKTDRVSRYEGSVASGELTVNHNTDGTKSITASIQAAVYVSTVNCSASGSFTLDKIARKATIVSAPNFNDEENPTITYSNPAGSAADKLEACISLTGETDDIKYRAISKTGTSYTFNLTEAERNVLRNAAKTKRSISVRFYVQTTIAGTIYRSNIAKTLTIVNDAPTLDIDVYDTNSAATALTGNSGIFIKFISDVKYTLIPTVKKGATVAHYYFNKCNDGSRDDWEFTTSNTATINNYDACGKFDFRLVDSRGNEARTTEHYTVVDYIKLTCEIDNKTPTTDGILNTSIYGNYFNGSFGAVNNTLTIQYRYKVNDGAFSDWITLTPTTSSGEYNADISLTGLDYKNTYTIEAKAADKLATATASRALKSIPVYDWSGEDFNINVPLHMANEAVLSRADSGKMMYIRPSGSDNTTGQTVFNPNGSVGISGTLTAANIKSLGDLYLGGIVYSENQLIIPVNEEMSNTQGIEYITAPYELETVPNGLVFFWSASNNDGYTTFFVPRAFYMEQGGGYISMNDAYAGMNKIVNITSRKIWGDIHNVESGTINGIKYDNEGINLAYIVGV